METGGATSKPKPLDWQANLTRKSISLTMAFKDFDQSQRFLSLVTKFIQDENGDDIVNQQYGGKE